MPIDEDESPRYRRAARKYRGKLLQARQEIADRDALIDELVGEHKALQGEHEEAAGKLGDLESQAKTKAFRAEFDKQAGKANVNPDYLDDLWKLAGIEPDDDEPDGKEMSKAIKEAVKRRPYMIAKAKEEGDEGEADTGTDEESDDEEASVLSTKGEQPMTKGEGHGRGGRTNLKPDSIDAIIDSDFVATGRDADQPFRI